MKYAIATHSHLFTVTLDSTWQVVAYNILNRGYHYGIALQDSAETLIAYHGGNHVYKQTTPYIHNYQRTSVNYQLGETQPLHGEWGDVHQMARGNGGFYFANTKYNRVVYRTAQGQTQYNFDGKDHDWNHVNSIYLYGDKILAILHNRARMESELAILAQNGDQLQLHHRLSLWDRGCHNVCVDGNYLYYNGSLTHNFVVVDLEADKVVQRISFPNWHNKGLSLTENHIVIGLSEHTIRDRRSQAQGKLAILDRRSWQLIKEVPLDFEGQPVGNINEIRCLTAPELAHAHPDAKDVDWQRLRFAQKQRWRYRASQLQLRLMYPLRWAKRTLRHRLA